MKSMLNTAGMVRPTETCCVPERDPATVEFQLERLRDAVLEARSRTTAIIEKISAPEVTEQGKSPMPGALYEAISQLATEAESTNADLSRITDIILRQLGNWRLE